MENITLLSKKIFDKKMVEFYDPVHGVRYWFARVKSPEEFDHVLVSLIPNCEKLIDLTPTEVNDQTGGECVEIILDNKLVIAFWADLTSIGSICHETLHAILFAAKSRGISTADGDEALCYMYEWLLDELFKKLKLTIVKHR